MIYPSTTWTVDPPESQRGVEFVMDLGPYKKPGPISRAFWWCWGILSTYLGRRE